MTVMQCEEVRPRLEAYLDGELVEKERPPVRDHLADCRDCGLEMAALERLRDNIRGSAPDYRAPAALRSQIRFALRREAAASPAPNLHAPGWLAYAVSLLLALAVGSGGTFVILGDRQHQDTIAGEVVDSHLRSLLGSHLTDVASSDQHTVKPWFAGRTDIAPPAVDLSAEGFPLVGGRLDLIAGQPVPALVYKRGPHVINLFVLPASTGDRAASLTRRGYSVRHWDEGDLSLWAVSDAAPSELAQFEHAFRSATGS
jgi:anti-sigma factor (TIGR02949 family)